MTPPLKLVMSVFLFYATGMDKQKNDGIYSHSFVAFTANGRYNLKVGIDKCISVYLHLLIVIVWTASKVSTNSDNLIH